VDLRLMPNIFRILLIEDNADDEQLTLRAMRKFGARFEAEVAHDGQEGLDRLLKCEDPLPDLVLLDLKLPKVSGLDVLRKLRSTECTASLKIVVLSAVDEPEELREAYLCYADGFMHKPVSSEDFAAVIGRLRVQRMDAGVL